MARHRQERSRIWLVGHYFAWIVLIVLVLYALWLVLVLAVGSTGEEISPTAALVLEFGWRTAFLSPAIIVLLLVVVMMVARSARRGRAILALEYVEQAVRLNLPLPQMLSAAEAGEEGTTRRCLTRLRELLEDGVPVAAALERALPGLPSRAAALVQSGERIGRLPHALQRALRTQRPAPTRSTMHAVFLRWYPPAMLLSLASVAAAVITFVIPKYQTMLSEFHQPMPDITRWLVTCWETLEIPLSVALLVVLALWCLRMLVDTMSIGRHQFRPWRPLLDRLAWVTPLWRGSVRNRALADVCYILADALEGGQPIDRALVESADAANNLVLRDRVNHWAQLVSGGEDLAQAARTAQMPAIVSEMLSTARGPDGARDVFSFLGRYYDTRFSAAAALLRAAAAPLMVAITATFVTIIALSVILPLVGMDDALMHPRGVL